MRIRVLDRPDAETGANGLAYLQGPVLVTTVQGGVCHSTLQFVYEQEAAADSEGERYTHE